MAVKGYVVLVAVLVFAGVVAPVARAQFVAPGLNVTAILQLVNINGIVPCSIGGIATSSPFPNATVVVTCAGSNVANTTTNNNGLFRIVLGLVDNVADNIAAALLNCRVRVTTPLVSCNAALPTTGSLSAPLILVNNVIPNINITFGPGGFLFSLA